MSISALSTSLIMILSVFLLGSAAMGAGGVTAPGCTIGQGISGVSMLAVPLMTSLASIVASSTYGLHWLLTGDAREAWHMLVGRDEA